MVGDLTTMNNGAPARCLAEILTKKNKNVTPGPLIRHMYGQVHRQLPSFLQCTPVPCGGNAMYVSGEQAIAKLPRVHASNQSMMGTIMGTMTNTITTAKAIIEQHA